MRAPSPALACLIVGEGTLPSVCGQLLLDLGHSVRAVVTRDVGLTQWAHAKGIRVVQPSTGFATQLRELSFDYAFSIVNPVVLKDDFLKLPRVATINYHDAPLPRYAGLFASSWALAHREAEHGISWHVVTDVLDAGDVLEQETVAIAPDETALSLNIKCWEAAARAFGRLVEALASGNAAPRKQDLERRTYFGRRAVLPAGGVLDFGRSDDELDSVVRATHFGHVPNEFAAAKVDLGTDVLVVTHAARAARTESAAPGTVLAVDDAGIVVACGSGALRIDGLETADGRAVVPGALGLSPGARLPLVTDARRTILEALESERAGAETFWVRRLAGAVPTPFPFARSTTRAGARRRESLAVDLGGADLDRVLATLIAFLARATGTTEVTIGYRGPTVEQRSAEEPVLGVPWVPFRMPCRPSEPFADVLERTTTERARVEQRGDYRRDVVGRLPSLRRQASEGSVAAYAIGVDFAGGTLASSVPPVVLQRDRLDYDPDVVPPEAVARFAAHLTTMLASASTTPEQRVGELRWMTDDERRHVLEAWNHTRVEYPEELGLATLFGRQLAAHGDRIAIEYGDRTITHRELERRANRVAHRLRRMGVRRGDFVALYAERKPETFVATLGIIKAGAAYVPLDAIYPEDRVAFMIEDTRPRVIMGHGALLAKLREPAAPLLPLEESLDDEPDDAPPEIATGRDLAYVMFTSGSTGKPKGVCVPQRAVASLVLGRDVVDLGPDDRVAQVTVLSFDPTAIEVWGPLLTGARLVIFDKDTVVDPRRLAAAIAATKLGAISITTALFNQIAEVAPTSLRTIDTCWVGGEQVDPNPIRRVLSDKPRRLLHTYGPTETTLFATYWPIEVIDDDATSLPIGKPLANKTAYVLDDALEPVPVGVPGEIYIGGLGNAIGYWQRPTTTAERFVPDPFGDRPSATLYRTGDLGRRLPDGSIEFLGRADNQIKIRGFRVELGEIEARLTALDGVHAAVVVALPDPAGSKRLVAYVVGGVSTDELKKLLAKDLPEYMIPSAFVAMDALPVTANGKVDRKALPAPDFSGGAAEYVAPRDVVEARLATLFMDVLAARRIGIHDDFFALGGHSLLATKLVARLQSVLGVELPVRAVFEASTVAKMAERVRSATATTRAVPLVRVDRSKPLPASFAQSRLWFLDQLEQGGSAAYNVPLVLRVEGRLDPAALEGAVRELVARHEVLRTTFIAVDGTPHQVIHPAIEVGLRVIEAASAVEAEAELRREIATPFDLERGPVLRAMLVRAPGSDIVLLDIHHVATDGWSAGILVRELAALYAAFAEGKPSPLPPPAFGYADYAAWQRERLSADLLERQLAFWRGHLGGAPAAIELPTDRPRPPFKQYAGGVVPVSFPTELSDRIRQTCRREGVTPFMLLLAAFDAVLARWSGQSEIVVGTPIANRTTVELESIVGFFVNTLALRTSLAGDPSFRELLRRVRRTALEAYTHQEVPFEKLVDELGITRDPSRTPIFQVMFQIDSVELEGVRLGPSVVVHEPPALDVAKFDLSLSLADEGDAFRGFLGYDVALFERSTAERLIEHLVVFLEAATRAPEERVAALPVMTEAERRRIFLEWSGASVPAFDGIAPLPIAVAEQARKTPDRPALVFGDEQLTYAELERAAAAVRERLRREGVRPGDRVALWMDRSAWAIVALLGIQGAGAAYVPIDHDAPAARGEAILADAGIRIVVADEAHGRLAGDRVGFDPRKLDAPNGASPITPGHVAYVLFTSGSTGTPKGILIPHTAVSSFARTLEAVLPAGRPLRVTQNAPLHFDASVQALVQLAYGHTVHVVSEAHRYDPVALARWIDATSIDVLDGTPTLIEPVLDAARELGTRLPETVLCGGEAVSPALWGKLLRDVANPVNVYGPTEVTVNSVQTVVRAGEPTIGRPGPGVRAYVLDAAGQPVPVGVAGELHLAGAQLAFAYLGRPELTAESFVPDPFVDRPGERMYRTGDRVRWRADGTIDYLGRLNAQVKLRGYRIELGEIETVLARCEGVGSAALAVREDASGTKMLVAYVVPSGPLTDLRRALAAQLPDYMVPAAIVTLDELPLNASGKVDRKALPAPDAVARATEWVSPRDAVEAALAAIFAEVLGKPRVGAEDDFFALGGHSLLATKLVARVRASLGAELPVRAVFGASTVAALATRVREATRAASAEPILPVDRTRPLPASFAQARLWFLDRYEPGSSTFNIPYTLRWSGRLDRAALARALDALVARHESLRTTFAAAGDAPVQVIAPTPEHALAFVDASGHADPEAEARRLTAAEGMRPYDLAAGPMFRTLLVRVRDDEHLLLLGMHHSVSDGWSIGVLRRELVALYDAFVRGEPSPLPAPALQYADFAMWQRTWLDGPRVDAQIAYWRNELAGATSLELPIDAPRAPIRSSRGATRRFVIDERVAHAVTALTRREGVSLFMTVLAGFATLLARLARQDDVTIGVAVANRPRVELEPIVGFFVNTLPLRLDVGDRPSTRALLARVREKLLAAQANQDVPFERLIEALRVPRDPSRTPFHAVSVDVIEKELQGDESPAGVQLVPVQGDVEVAELDLSLVIHASRGAMSAQLVYSTALFEAVTIDRIGERLVVLLEAMASAPDAPVHDLPILSESERRRVLVEWNAARPAPARSEASLHELVVAQAARMPAELAVADANGAITYGELATRADAIARRLVARGVRRGDVVALLLPRTVDAIVAMLGVLEAGAAYLPIDRALPEARIRYILDDSVAALALGSVDLAGIDPRVVTLETLLSGNASTSALPSVGPRDLAYIIYTSGSTGTPKGVCIEHASIVALAREQAASRRLGVGTRHAQYASLSFDAHVSEVWPSLVCGASLHLVPDATRPDHPTLIAWFARERVSWAFIPTQIGEECLRAEWPAVELVGFGFGGDTFHGVPARAYPFDVLNVYGPTECTCVATSAVVPPGDMRPSIGRPIGGVRIYVLDDEQRPVPAGVMGELYIGGTQVGRGYLRRPDLTAERFVPDPFAREPGVRMYRTGDVGRFRADGTIEHLGRNDHQVKIRGFRIELGEIEAALAEQPLVAESVVVVREDKPGDKRVVAYVVPHAAGPSPSAGELRAFLKQRLADYMVPSAFVTLPAFVVDVRTGKVDRKALPAPDADALETAAWVAPEGEIEQKLAAIWTEVLGVERVSAEDDFFALGGHSLVAVRVTARVQRDLGVELPVRSVFTAPTLRALAQELASRAPAPDATAIPKVGRDGPLPLSYPQERLWFLTQLDPGSTAFNMPLARRLVGALDRRALGAAVRELVVRHEVLRTAFVELDGKPRQNVSPPPEDVLVFVEGNASDVSRFVDEHATARFDLAHGPFRAKLVRLGANDHLLLINVHHIASDGWSMDLLERELAELYAAFADGRPSPLPPLPIQFADYAVWQRRSLEGERARSDLAYWVEHLAGAPPALELPTDRPHPPTQTHRGEEEYVRLSPDRTRALQAVAQSCGASIFMTLLAAFSTLLARHAAQEDVVIGVPIAERSRAEVEPLIGFFLNTIPLRVTTAGNPTFASLVAQARDVALAGYAHQDVPFEKVVEELRVERSLSRTPIFQVMLVARTFDRSVARGLRGLDVTPIYASTFRSKYDLTLYYDEDESGLGLCFDYDADIFDRARMRELAAQLVTFLGAATERPDTPVRSLALLTDVGRRVVPDPTAPIEVEVQAPVQRTVFDRTEPVAVVWNDVRWSYAELRERAQRIARVLHDRGVVRGDRVLVTGVRSPGAVAAMLGVWAAGAAIVPIGDDVPEERLRVISEESGAVLALVVGASAPVPIPAVAIDAATGRAEGAGDAPPPSPEREATEHDPAYVFFTSGTTGKPKGVLGWHRGLAHFLRWQRSRFEVGPADRAAQLTGLGFDVVMRDVFTPLGAGATLHIPPLPLGTMEPKAAFAWLRDSAITMLHSVPSVMEAFLTGWTDEAPYDGLRIVFIAGEPLTDVLVARIRVRFPRARIVNLYGPTETTLAKCFYEVPADPRPGTQPVGRPMPQTQVLIVNEAGVLCGVNEAGEIVLRTPYRSLGYLNETRGAASRFQPNPFAPDAPDDVVYRTGDRGRWRLDGEIEILGRVDDQVKIRGVRVEPAEVSAVVRQHVGITACFVTAFRDPQGQNALVAYVVGTSDVASLRAFLTQRLPPAMVPSAFMVLERMPLTANGKVDRKALPPPTVTAVRTAEYVAPRTPTERAIAEIWQEVLNVERVGVHDDYFALGGHSLTVTRIVAHIRSSLAFELHVRDVFERPTVALLAEMIANAGDTETF